ncbi:MAG: hypothetical protein D6768_01930 [Chloroflexi bacterium]|nr:MAG: hypothetical protein D6768_01930 [Chloroflexota bacterium]
MYHELGATAKDFWIRHSPFAIRHSLFAIRYSLFAIRHSLPPVFTDCLPALRFVGKITQCLKKVIPTRPVLPWARLFCLKIK